LHHRERVDRAAVDAADRNRAAPPDALEAGEERTQPVDAGALDHRPGDRVGQVAGRLLGELAKRRAVRLHADSIDGRVGAATVRELADALGNPSGVARTIRDVEDLDAVVARHREPLRDEVDPDHAGALVARDPRRHLTDRPEAEDRH
jgi:hypothetical protein